MSQRGPASRPPSHRSSSKSPSRDSRASPGSSQPGGGRQRDERQRDQPFETDVIPTTNGQGRMQYLPPRGFGVHNILNPSEAQAQATLGRGGVAGGARPLTASGFEGGPPTAMMAVGQAGGGGPPSGQPYVFQGTSALGPQHHGARFSPSMVPSGPPPQDRGSPTLTSPHPTFGSQRRGLIPRSPRGIGMGRGSPLTSYSSHSPLRTGATPQETSSGPPIQSFIAQASGIPHPTATSTSGATSATPTSAPTPSRSLSQPIFGNVLQRHQPQEPSQQGLAGRDQQPQPPVFPAGTTFGPGLLAGRPLGGAPHTGGDGQWPPGMRKAQTSGGRTMSASDSQQFITITPSYGEEIHVPVDVHQASKQADEKRLRNAGASARFRARKKEKDKEVQAGMNKLDEENRDLKRRVQDLEADREHYRNERNRLRQVLYQTPGMREIADSGPPSPTSTTRSGGSFAAESSPMSVPSQLQPPSSVPSYVTTDPSGAEHPARRRRTDPSPALDFSMPSYGPPMPTSLPPMAHPGFSLAPPAIVGSPASQRLPPLRLDRPSLSPTSEHPPNLSAPPPPTQPPGPPSQYPPFTRPPYETGWATGPRPPYDPPQR